MLRIPRGVRRLAFKHGVSLPLHVVATQSSLLVLEQVPPSCTSKHTVPYSAPQGQRPAAA